MAGLFALAPAPLKDTDTAPRFVLPALDEDAPGVDRLLGALGRGAARGPAISTAPFPLESKLEDGVVPRTPEEALPPLPDLADLSISHTHAGAVFPSLDIDVLPGQNDDDDEDADVAGVRDTVYDWRAAAECAPGPLRHARPLTWDADRARLLSECAPGDFEALLVSYAPFLGPVDTRSEPPLSLPKLRTPAAEPPAPGKSVLDLLMRATLGTALSGTVRWSRRRGGFVYSETGPRPAGIERRTAQSAMDEFLAIGTAVRRLEIIVADHSATLLTPTHHALLYALSTLLTYVKARLAAGVEATFEKQGAPWLRRGVALRETRQLATALCEVMCWPLTSVKPVGLPARPATVLTHLHSHLLARLSTSTEAQQRSYTTLALAFLLSHASKPFLDLLHQWLGLADSSRIDDDDDVESQPWSDLGITRSRLPAADGVDVRWEYAFSARRMPTFVPRDVRRMLFDAGRSLRALRAASHGQHPLCGTDWPLHASWGWGAAANAPANDLRGHARRVQRDIDRWRDVGRSRMGSVTPSSFRRRQTMYTPTPPGTLPSSRSPTPATDADVDFWKMVAAPPGSHLASDPAPLWAPAPLDELEAFVTRHSDPAHPLLPADAPTLELYISSHLLAPLLAHATLISRALVSLYLDDLHFLDHLDVLRAFWLGGDAGFAERVGAALFGKDDGGGGSGDFGIGHRARTRARLGLGTPDDAGAPHGDWGVGLGVGLSDRKRWPPGGAELAYALRTTLLDEEVVVSMASRGVVWEGIEDRVSFAVRNLPDDDRDGRRARWLNPQSVEALDFLYLAYSPPAPLAILLPASIMDKYQTIHNFLLRLSRVEAVLRGLYYAVLRPAPPADGVPVKTGVDATHTRLPSQIGLPPRAPLGPFAQDPETHRAVLRLRFDMSWFVSALGRYVMDTAIGHNWDVMRRRLDKLRRRAHSGGGVSSDSRPTTPAPDDDDEYEDLDEEVGDADAERDDDDDPESEGMAQLGALSQLQSAHSLVLYHNIILNRILRACLLSDKPGHQVTFKILMILFSLILDFAKVVAEVERGVMSPLDGAARVATIRQNWYDKHDMFLHAVHRLSLRTSAAQDQHASEKPGEEADLQLLLDGEARDDDATASALPGSLELQELLLRLKLGAPGVRRGGAQM